MPEPQLPEPAQPQVADEAPRTPGSAAPAPAPPAPASPRSVVGAVAGFATVLGLAVLAVLPAPYTSSAPGPTFDTLGETSAGPLVRVEGHETYESTGELRLTTVSFAGSRERQLDLVTVLRGWLSPQVTIDPVERFFPDPDPVVDQAEQSRQEMTTSQENATVAALTELGIPVPATITVVEPIEGSGATGILLPGDRIVRVEDTEVVTYRDMTDALRAIPGGATVRVGVLREGEEVEVELVSGEREDGSALLGVWVDPEFDMPFEVTIQLDDVGGPSAGTMFALGIVDLLTPEDEAGGAVIAGTGTIDLEGRVGPISGIRQKMIGAVRDGATAFLAPRDNCQAVVGNVPEGLRVVAVSTLAEARAAVEAIGAGRTEGLPSC